jgi:hypothetical protein
VDDGAAERARKYRQRAEELRAIAQDWVDHQAHQMMLKIASDYERMADQLEDRVPIPTPDALKDYRSGKSDQ